MPPRTYMLLKGIPYMKSKMYGESECPLNCVAKRVEYEMIFVSALTPDQPTPLKLHETEHGVWRLRISECTIKSNKVPEMPASGSGKIFF